MPIYRKKEGYGKHTFNFNGKKHVVKAGECTPDVPKGFIPKAFMDTYDLADGSVESAQTIAEGAPKKGLKAIHKGAGKYEVINEATGKPINDILLSKDDALSLIGQLENTTDKKSSEAGGGSDNTDLTGDEQENPEEVARLLELLNIYENEDGLDKPEFDEMAALQEKHPNVKVAEAPEADVPEEAASQDAKD